MSTQLSCQEVAFSPVTPLPVSETSYTWRLRPLDARGRPGPWTDLADPKARFRVVGEAPTPTGPATDYVAGNDLLFTWDGVDGASSYRFERRLAGSPIAETVQTPGLAWAPTLVLTDGLWEWRVSSLDADGKVIRASAWTSFRVDSTRPAVTSASPRSGVPRATNFVAKFSEPVDNVSNANFRIYKSGSTSPLTATVSLNSTRRGATLNPAANLRAGTSYVLKLSSSIRDDAGNLLTPYSWKVRAR